MKNEATALTDQQIERIADDLTETAIEKVEEVVGRIYSDDEWETVRASVTTCATTPSRWSRRRSRLQRGSCGRVLSTARKPDAFYDLVETVSPGPYLEMFARRARMGDWHYWGDQSHDTAGGGGMTFMTPSELRHSIKLLLDQRDQARAQLAGILVALGIELPVPHDEALEVALDRIEELFGPDAAPLERTGRHEEAS